MKAVICTSYGSPEVLEVRNIEKPVPKDNEILIRIHASSLSHADGAFRKGEPFVSRLFTGLSKPKYPVPGDIISGVIESTGKNVKLFKDGDQVFGHTGLTFGAQAEYVTLDEGEAVIIKPSDMTHSEAAAIAYSAMTALPFLTDHSTIENGTQILINGASGAIGTFAVQIAKNLGAEVTGVCGSANLEMVKSLGANYVIDYTQDEFVNNIDSYDIIFDAVGKSSFSKCKNSLKDGGIYLSTVPALGLMINMLLTSRGSKKAKFIATGLRKNPKKIEDLNILAKLFNEGVIKSVIDRTYTLEQIVDAHTYVDKGHNKGNVILTLNDKNI